MFIKHICKYCFALTNCLFLTSICMHANAYALINVKQQNLTPNSFPSNPDISKFSLNPPKTNQFMGTQVGDDGLIEIIGKSATLTSGKKIAVSFEDQDYLSFIVDEPDKTMATVPRITLLEAFGNIENLSNSEDKILIRQKVAENVLDKVVNMRGVAQAQSFLIQHGEIILTSSRPEIFRAAKTIIVANRQKQNAIKVVGRKVITQTVNIIQARNKMVYTKIFANNTQHAFNSTILNGTNIIDQLKRSSTTAAKNLMHESKIIAENVVQKTEMKLDSAKVIVASQFHKLIENSKYQFSHQNVSTVARNNLPSEFSSLQKLISGNHPAHTQSDSKELQFNDQKVLAENTNVRTINEVIPVQKTIVASQFHQPSEETQSYSHKMMALSATKLGTASSLSEMKFANNIAHTFTKENPTNKLQTGSVVAENSAPLRKLAPIESPITAQINNWYLASNIKTPNHSNLQDQPTLSFASNVSYGKFDKAIIQDVFPKLMDLNKIETSNTHTEKEEKSKEVIIALQDSITSTRQEQIEYEKTSLRAKNINENLDIMVEHTGKIAQRADNVCMKMKSGESDFDITDCNTAVQ
jgi:hypothetical protein